MFKFFDFDRFKSFSLSGLTICPEDTSPKATELDSWYGYSIIKTKEEP